MQRIGLEWLWRIKEEPYLWKRYWTDGTVLLRLMLTRVLPLIIWTWWLQLKHKHCGKDLVVTQTIARESVILTLSGPATVRHIDKVITAFRNAFSVKKSIIIDLSNATLIDARFLGLVLVLIKKMKGIGANVLFTSLSPELQRMFRLYGLGFLLSY
jgi:N-acetylglucosaminyldiphosphoundecaprenol N-acetyl-beta-D-mannosaminyltransferase